MIERNAEILMDEIQRCSEKPMTTGRAEHLAACKNALEALSVAFCEECGKYHAVGEKMANGTRNGTIMGRYSVDIGDGRAVVDREDDGMLTPEDAKAWVDGMENQDGTRGMHWTKDQVANVAKAAGIKADTERMWVAINAVYSDIGKTLAKYGITKPEAIAEIAYAFWLDDADAVPDKLYAYWDYVVKH